jgi:CheY-specific phosphatase CheX
LANPTIAEALKAGTLSQCQEELLAHLEDAAREVFKTMQTTMCELVSTTSDVPPPKPRSHTITAGAHGSHEVSIEAVVEFRGMANGAVLLRCTHDSAADIARGLLMLGAEENVELAEVRDALGECANMVTGVLKRRALDPHGEFRLSLPKIGTHVGNQMPLRMGTLVFKLAEGCTGVEIWLEDDAPTSAT